MSGNRDTRDEIAELKHYLDDVRTIRRTLDETEGTFRIFYWFYYVMAALVVVGAGVNIVLVNTAHLTMHESFIFVWIPVFFLSGAAEMLAWILKSTRENVPLVTQAFARYIVALGGVMIGLFAIAFLFIRPGVPVPGLVLLLVGMMFCIPLQYTHFLFVIEAVGLIALGIFFVLLDLEGPAYFIVDGVMVALVLVLAGVIEQILSRRERHG